MRKITIALIASTNLAGCASPPVMTPEAMRINSISAGEARACEFIAGTAVSETRGPTIRQTFYYLHESASVKTIDAGGDSYRALDTRVYAPVTRMEIDIYSCGA